MAEEVREELKEEEEEKRFREYLELLQSLTEGVVNPNWVRNHMRDPEEGWRMSQLARVTKLARLMVSVISNLTDHRWSLEELSFQVDELEGMTPSELRTEWDNASEYRSRLIQMLKDAGVLSLK